MKTDIQVMIQEMSGALPGTAEYFSKYQAGLKEVCDTLPNNIIEEYRLQAREWNEAKPPVQVQQA